jgi:hypothetical protein
VFSQRVKDAIKLELDHALAARENGMEGRARVCARRASGYAIRAYLEDRRIDTPDISALALIRQLDSLSSVSPRVKAVTEHLLMRVDANFTLPVEADLIAEATWLVGYLENET